MNLMSLAWRNIFRNRRRSALTLGTIGVAATATLLLGGYLAATVRALETDTVREVGHLQVMPEGSLDFGRGQPARYALHDPASLIARITQDATLAPMVAVVTPMLRFSGVAGRFESGASSNFAGIGWDPAMRLKLLEWDGNGLRLPPAASFLRADQPQGGVIGAGLAQLLGLCHVLQVRDCKSPPAAVHADAAPLSAELVALAAQSSSPQQAAESTPVIELLAASAGGAPNVLRLQVLRAERLGAREADAMHVAVPLPLAQRLVFGAHAPAATAVVVQLHRTADLAAARERLQTLVHDAVPGQALEVLDYHQVQPQFGQVIRMFGALFGFVAVLMIVVTLFSVSNTIHMAVAERTREIGTLRAIGWLQRRVRSLFVTEAALLGVLGSLIGLGVAAALGHWVINTGWLTWTPPGRSTPVPIGVDLLGHPALIPGALLLFMALACASAWWPARRAASLPVVEALRHA